MTLDLCRRIDSVASNFQAARVAGIAEQPGNPWGVGISLLPDGGRQLTARKLPLDWMNTAYGVSTERDCIEALDRFKELGVKPRFEMPPGCVSREIANHLHKAGLRHTLYHCAVYGLPLLVAADSYAPDASARQIADDEIEDFLDVFLAGFETPEGSRAGSKSNMRHWADRAQLRLYVAEVAGEAAGAGVLFIDDKVGYLAAAATAPSMRSRGAQTALIRRRIQDAAKAGCELVTGQADFGSTSQQNMQRAGLQIAYTKAVWTTA